ncbi:MAG: hypothetical protein AAGA48_02915 [Myxococcota bacterium]
MRTTMLACLLMGCTGGEGSAPETGTPAETGAPVETGAPDNDATDDVGGLVIRQLKPDVALADFEAARDAYVAALEAQPGISTDREFEAFVDFGTFAAPEPAVFIGFTQGDSLAAFQAAADAVGTTPEAATFFGSFDLVTFGLLAPLEAGTPVDLAGIASEEGQILEVAVRDFSTYPDFDLAAYEAARDTFLPILGAQPGVVAEFQWISPADPNLAVGMTVYTDQASYVAVATDEKLTGSPEYIAFVQGYPLAAGYAATVVK